ncbi:MAG TPA: dihydroorotase family protein [Candidatus Nanoarchaeia archaeon]|nr:dihydroorotase family protein [Candidatus Nanoarchaeia archaeon]
MYIDAHVHLRDFKQKHKETIFHGLEVARDSGLDAVFDMPNTDPAITSRDIVVERLKIARAADVPEVFYGLYMGVTADIEQLKLAVEVCHEFPEVIGMKLYAGHSVGNLGVTRVEDQDLVYRTLAVAGYDGVLVVHAEKETVLHPSVWNPSIPISHCHARPESAEIASLEDQLRLAYESGFKGKLHVAHISSPRAADLVVSAKARGVDISCGICPHHFIYDWTQMLDERGILWKMNPPLRRLEARDEIFNYLRQGKIDWIETDHAPHTLGEKTESPFMSGIPGLAWWPLFEEFLRHNNFSDELIEKLVFHNAARRFGIDVKRSKRQINDRRKDYPFDPYKKIGEEIGWPK